MKCTVYRGGNNGLESCFAEGHCCLEIDVSSARSVDKALIATIEKFRRPPTVVVNSAGITKDGFLLKMTENDFDSVISVNLKVGGWLDAYSNLFTHHFTYTCL